jgi:predicted transcriptional regulator
VTVVGRCVTVSYREDDPMSTLTIRLDEKLARELERLAKRAGRSKSELAREALRRHLAVQRFRAIRGRLMPYAEAAGWLTDEDVFRDVS